MTIDSTLSLPVTTDPHVARLAEAFAATRRVLAAIGDDDATTTTPCPEWDVATVAEHIVGALGMFAGALGAPATPVEGDLLARFDGVSTAVLTAWRAPARFDGDVTLPFGAFPAPLAATINLVETFVHACDLAVATDRVDLVDDAFCDEVRQLADDAGFDAFRLPGMFGPACEPADSSGLSRLLGYMGRSIDRGLPN